MTVQRGVRHQIPNPPTSPSLISLNGHGVHFTWKLRGRDSTKSGRGLVCHETGLKSGVALCQHFLFSLLFIAVLARLVCSRRGLCQLSPVHDLHTLFLLAFSWSVSKGIHHHHRHLSLHHEGRWGTTDDFTTSVLHISLFSSALWDLANSKPVHSMMLSSHLCFCLPLLLPPFTVPRKMGLARPDERET